MRSKRHEAQMLGSEESWCVLGSACPLLEPIDFLPKSLTCWLLSKVPLAHTNKDFVGRWCCSREIRDSSLEKAFSPIPGMSLEYQLQCPLTINSSGVRAKVSIFFFHEPERSKLLEEHIWNCWAGWNNSSCCLLLDSQFTWVKSW